MKATNQAWYWLAAGVLALGLNGYYQDGGLQGLHQLAGQATAAIVEERAQFSQMATLAEVALAEHARFERPAPAVVAVSPDTMPPDAPARLAELQERLGAREAARVQAKMACLRQVMARREVQQAEVELRDGRLAVLANPGQVRVVLPPLPRVEVKVPQVAVEFGTN